MNYKIRNNIYIIKKTTRSVNVGFPSETGDYTGASLKTGPPLSSQKIGYKLHVRGPPLRGLTSPGARTLWLAHAGEMCNSIVKRFSRFKQRNRYSKQK